MFVIIVALAVLIGPFYLLIKAIAGSNAEKPAAPRPARKQDPADKHMDETYADIDWLRNGKL